MFLEKDFPKANDVPELSDSPKNLGISRADLWHFAGLIALDRAQERTHSLCSTQKQNLTCSDFSPCFSSFPLYLTRSLFKTGRTDCIPHPAALPEHGFRSTGLENEPDKNGNGKQTTCYSPWSWLIKERGWCYIDGPFRDPSTCNSRSWGTCSLSCSDELKAVSILLITTFNHLLKNN